MSWSDGIDGVVDCVGAELGAGVGDGDGKELDWAVGDVVGDGVGGFDFGSPPATTAYRVHRVAGQFASGMLEVVAATGIEVCSMHSLLNLLNPIPTQAWVDAQCCKG